MDKTSPFKTPILFLVFNRPDVTKEVFEVIRRVKPEKLFIACDGPRADKPGEEELVKEVREIVNNIDWNCEVKKLFRDKNSGCKVSVSSAIDWFFENVEEGIILEDDCLPDLSFFPFCRELLERYRNDERIGMISGDNFLFGKKRTDYSYYFSRFTFIWGWATWKRAWEKYDVNMKLWTEIRDNNWLYDILGDKKAVSDWSKIYENVYSGKIDTWDYQWTFTCWMNNFFIIVPDCNLISNIGFRGDGTHTKNVNKYANLPLKTFEGPLKHPPFLIQDKIADNIVQKEKFHNKPVIIRAIRKLQKYVRGEK